MANQRAVTGAEIGHAQPIVRTIGMADLGDALSHGYADFKAMPTHLVSETNIDENPPNHSPKTVWLGRPRFNTEPHAPAMPAWTAPKDCSGPPGYAAAATPKRESAEDSSPFSTAAA